MRFSIKVVPGASRNEVVGWMSPMDRQGLARNTLKLRVTAAPEKGRANEAVETLLADILGLPRQSVRVVAGFTAARKLVEIDGLDDAQLLHRFSA